MNAKFVTIDGGEPIPVVESAQLQDDFQAISASKFLDLSGRKTLWPSLDDNTRLAYGEHVPLLETVFAYQSSEGETLTDRIVTKTYAKGADILPVVLAPEQIELSVRDGDGEGLEYMDQLRFEEHSDCYRYVVIAEADSYDYNVPVAIHEKSYLPHLRLHDDVLTRRAMSGIISGDMMDGMKDARSGVTMCTSLNSANPSNW